MSLLRGDNSPIGDGSEHFGIPMHRLDDRRADEDRVIIILRVRRLFELWDIEVGFERIDLASKRVPLHFDIHKPKQGLVAADIFGKEDRARARPPDRVALPELFQRLHQDHTPQPVCQWLSIPHPG